MSIVTYRRAMAMIRDVISFIILFFGIIGPMIPPLGGGDDAEDDVVDVGMVILFLYPFFVGGRGGGMRMPHDKLCIKCLGIIKEV